MRVAHTSLGSFLELARYGLNHKMGYGDWGRRDGGSEGQEGARPSPYILADQLTLYEPLEHVMPPIFLLAPSDFQTKRHPWRVLKVMKGLS